MFRSKARFPSWEAGLLQAGPAYRIRSFAVPAANHFSDKWFLACALGGSFCASFGYSQRRDVVGCHGAAVAQRGTRLDLTRDWPKAMPPKLLKELYMICGEDLGWAKSKKAKLMEVDEDGITTDKDARLDHSKPSSSYHDLGPDKKPFVVVYPRNEEEICKIAEACNQYKMPIVPWGGGTSLEGHLLAPECGVSIDMCNLDRLLDFNKANCTVTCEAGLGYLQLNEQLLSEGFWFPLDPGPGATLGGMAANSCSGSTACKYGTMRENTISTNTVLASGQLVKTANYAPKTSAGYNLTNLIVGSEGTLGVITQVTLRVFPLPRHRAALMAFFPDIADAARCAFACKAAGVDLGKCEMMDNSMMEVINKATVLSLPLKTVLMFDIHGSNPLEVQDRLQIVKSISLEFNGSDLQLEDDPAKMQELWRIRKEALWSCSTVRPDASAMITDVCVPQDKLADVISETKAELDSYKAHGIPAPIVAHTLDGNFHAFIMIDATNQKELDLAHGLAHNMAHRAIDAGGSCTGEHGIGIGKIEYLEHEVGVNAVHTMMLIKRALDPNNIMNPDKVVPGHCVCEGAAAPTRGAAPAHYVLHTKQIGGKGSSRWTHEQ